MKANYTYQYSAAQSIFNMAISNAYKAAVLAAAPGAGKSTIIIHILNMFRKDFSELSIVILTHNQNLLKLQMLEGFEDGFVTPDFTYGEIGDDVQVQVGIPSSRSKIKSCDILIVDEAHHYYGAKMIEDIQATHKPKFEVLMTGSPSIYNEANQKAGKPIYGIHYISGEELVENDVYSNIIIDVVKTTAKGVVERYKDMAIQIKRDARFDMTKVMIACKTMQDAYDLGIYLKTIGRKIAISTSENDADGLQIKRFKTGEADTLLVVNRGILGFSDNLMTGLIDLKGSKDVDARNQILARILRKHPQGIKKFYVSAATPVGFNKEVELLYKVTGLMEKKIFQTYTK